MRRAGKRSRDTKENTAAETIFNHAVGLAAVIQAMQGAQAGAVMAALGILSEAQLGRWRGVGEPSLAEIDEALALVRAKVAKLAA